MIVTILVVGFLVILSIAVSAAALILLVWFVVRVVESAARVIRERRTS